MFRRTVLIALATGAVSLAAEERSVRTHLNVSHYVIEADVNPRTQALTANVQVQFIPLDDNLTTASFELNNALNISRVVDGNGRQVPASRSTQDFTVRNRFRRASPPA
jgi:hypothetical protein